MIQFKQLNFAPCHPEPIAKGIITIPQEEPTQVKEVPITVSPQNHRSEVCVEHVSILKDSHSLCHLKLTDSNSNGSYYYSNDNDSKYYNSGSGHSSYTPSGGPGGKK